MGVEDFITYAPGGKPTGGEVVIQVEWRVRQNAGQDRTGEPPFAKHRGVGRASRLRTRLIFTPKIMFMERIQNFCRRNVTGLLPSPAQPVNTPLPPAAVIDGTLCQLTRQGARAISHAPLATAVVEFRRGPMCFFVREHPHGLLPGIPNLYCLDGALRLQWLAEWPLADDPCATIVRIERDTLTVVSTHGVVVRLDAHTGRLLSYAAPVAVAS